WIEAIKRAWGPEEDFDIEGQFFKLKKIRAKPKPFGGTRPMIMNAGSTATGQAFALRNCDAYFTATSSSRLSVDNTTKMGAEIKRDALAGGREIEVYTIGQVVCRPTQREAEDYYRHAVIEHADWGAIDGMLKNRGITRESLPADEYEAKRRYFAANAIGGYP